MILAMPDDRHVSCRYLSLSVLDARKHVAVFVNDVDLDLVLQTNPRYAHLLTMIDQIGGSPETIRCNIAHSCKQKRCRLFDKLVRLHTYI